MIFFVKFKTSEYLAEILKIIRKSDQWEANQGIVILRRKSMKANSIFTGTNGYPFEVKIRKSCRKKDYFYTSRLTSQTKLLFVRF